MQEGKGQQEKKGFIIKLNKLQAQQKENEEAKK
jgi:hypothetical protein